VIGGDRYVGQIYLEAVLLVVEAQEEKTKKRSGVAPIKSFEKAARE
jgi:hypothetical protein